MANNKYKYYVVMDGTIVSEEFKNFEDAIPIFLHQFNYCKMSSYLAIIKAENKDDIKRVNVSCDRNSNFYILVKFGSNNGSMEGPITENISDKLKKSLNSYGSNHCKFFGIIRNTKKESMSLYNKF